MRLIHDSFSGIRALAVPFLLPEEESMKDDEGLTFKLSQVAQMDLSKPHHVFLIHLNRVLEGKP